MSYPKTNAFLHETVRISRTILAANNDFPNGEIHDAIDAYN